MSVSNHFMTVLQTQLALNLFIVSHQFRGQCSHILTTYKKKRVNTFSYAYPDIPPIPRCPLSAINFVEQTQEINRINYHIDVFDTMWTTNLLPWNPWMRCTYAIETFPSHFLIVFHYQKFICFT